jgi:hypothetical protein
MFVPVISAGGWAAGQKIALGRIHSRQVVTVHVADQTITIELDD